MAKTKYNNQEEAVAAKTAAKEALEAAKAERSQYAKDNGLKTGKDVDHSGDKKHGKSWTKMTNAIKAQRLIIEEADAWMKDNKPAKEKKERVMKYDYPKGCESEGDKKKFRAKTRAEVARAEKGEPTPKKKDKKAEAPKEESKKSKKGEAPIEEGKKVKSAKPKED